MNIYVAAVHDRDRNEYFLLGAYEEKNDAMIALSRYVEREHALTFRAKRKNRAWQAETERYTTTVELCEVEPTSMTQRIADPIEPIQHKHVAPSHLNTIGSIYGN